MAPMNTSLANTAEEHSILLSIFQAALVTFQTVVIVLTLTDKEVCDIICDVITSFNFDILHGLA